MDHSHQVVKPFLIIGQGLAGSCLALEWAKRGVPFEVVESGHQRSATWVAAGLFNPFTGPKMQLTWQAEVLFPLLHDFYKSAETLLGSHFFHSKPLYRPFASISQQNDVLASSSETPTFVSTPTESPQTWVQAPFDGLWTAQSGFLHTQAFLTAVADWLQAEKRLHQMDWSETDITIDPDGFPIWQGKYYEAIIDARGWQLAQSRWWQWLPLRPNKGEVWQIHWQGPSTFIPNRQVYLVETAREQWRVGATYTHEFTDLRPTQASYASLDADLRELISGDFQILLQETGVRPASADRRPLLGKHPNWDRLFVLSGLGSKGVSLAPWCVRQLADHILDGAALPEVVDIARFRKRFPASL